MIGLAPPLLFLLAATPPQGAEGGGMPGDDAPLRSQAFLHRLPESPARLAAEGDRLFEAREIAAAFAAFRRALEEAPADWRLYALDETRLYTDLTAHVRRLAASLDGSALEQYLADAERIAGSAFQRALTVEDVVEKASALPRTARAAAALADAAARLAERGDLCGGRAAFERILATGAGSPAERAAWRLRAAALAAALGDLHDDPPGEREGAAPVSLGGETLPLRQALDRLRPTAPRAAAPGLLRERWRVAAGPSAPSVLRAEPAERVASVCSGSIAVQTASELLLLDVESGAVAARVDLTQGDPTPGPRRPQPRSGALARPAAFPGKRRARPACDERFLAVTANGVLRVFERAHDGGLSLLWTKGEGFPSDDGTTPDGSEPPISLYCDGALLVGGRLFVASVSVAGDTTTRLECFDPVTGQGIFSRTLSKGNVLEAAQERRFAGRLEIVFPEPLRYGGGRVLVATGVGVVASVDPLDGELDYVLRIQRSDQPGAYDLGILTGSGSVVLAAPQDSDFAYALETRLPTDAGARCRLPFAFDGGPLSRRDSRHDSLFRGAFRRPVGSAGSRLFFVGNVQVTRRRIQSFDFATRQYLDNEFAPGEEVLGLPAFSGQALYVPTNHGIVSLDLTNGIRDVAQTPLPRSPATRLPYRAEEFLGDLTAVPGGIVSVSREWITFYEPVP